MTLLYDWLKKAAKAQGNNKALVYRDNYLSWRGLLHRVDRRAQEFKAMGIKKDAWVGLMLGNVPDFVILALALSKIDAAIVPIDPTTGARELELMLAAAPVRALVTRPRGSEGSITASGTSTPQPAPTPRGRGSRTTQAPVPETPSEEVPEIRRRLQGTLLTCSVFKRATPKRHHKPALILFTADSLGDPKGVVRTAPNLMAITDNSVASLKVTTDSKILTAVPLYHAYGWDVGLLPALKTGATIHLEEEISARRVGKILREHDVDILPGTPLMYSELGRLPTAKILTAKSPRFLSSGSRLDPEIASVFADKYGVKIMSAYQSTEAGLVTVDDKAKSPATVGKAIDGIELKVTLPTGKPAGSKEGVIWVRGKSLSPEAIGPYSEGEPVTKGRKVVGIGETDKTGWYRTGDLGKVDRSGRLTLTGREDDLVKVEGKRVALGEVEGCLESFAKVKAAQARIEDDPVTGTVVVARVVAKSRCQAEEIIDHCARNLAPYKVPRRIEFCESI